VIRVPTTAILLAFLAALIAPAGAQPAPSIRIVAPRAGAAVSGSQMVVEVRVRNFYLTPMSIGKASRPGEGHWYVYVDGKFAGLSADEVVSLPNDTYPALAAGKHRIRVALRNNDHTAVMGAVNEITVTIPKKSAMHYAPAAGQPGIKIMVPHDQTEVSPYLVVWVKVQGFKASAAGMGTATKDGEGHWKLSVDGRAAGLSSSMVADVSLARGTHMLEAALLNNDGTPVSGASNDQVTVNVR